MLLSILANLIGFYSLIALPVVTTQTIDISQFKDTGQIDLLERVYLSDAPFRKNNSSLGIEISAPSAMIVDKKTGLVLWQKNPNEVRSLASLTKLMTALVFLDNNPGWETEVMILESDYRNGGRRYVYAGEKVLLRDIFNTALVASSNDATMALARSTGLSPEDFINQMNLKAHNLGMLQSFFVEPTGLDPQNISSAQDVITLIQVSFNQPEIVNVTSKLLYSFDIINVPRSYTVENTNLLLKSYLRVMAGKTGYLDEAGYCLTSLIKGTKEQEIYLVVLGSDSEYNRFQEVKSLAQWTFDNYYWPN